ncbi:MAG: hypothetical protein ACT443_07140, partial [Gemmatimonadota bacterium]
MRRRLLPYLVLFSLVLCAPAFAQTGQGEHVTRGLAALERFEQAGDAEAAADAARSFALALRENRDDAWAHYGLGMTLFKARKTMAIVRRYGAADGEAIFVAKRSLLRALDLKPDFREAAEALALVAARLEDTSALERARGVLGKRDDRAGNAACLAGIDAWNEASAAACAADLDIIASDHERQALRAGTLGERAAAVRLFWQKRAVRDGVSSEQRIGEHYRRLAIARRDYRRPERRGAPGPGAIVKPHAARATEIDDRGVIYVRYGEPFDKISVTNALTRANETWAYRQPDGSVQHFRFAALDFSSGYQLVSDPVAMLNVGFDSFRMGGPRAWARLASDQNFANATHFFDEQGRYDPKWRLLSMRISSLHTQLMAGSSNWENTAGDIHMDNLAWSKQNEISVRAALERDLAAPAFEKPLVVFHDFATFRGRGCTDLVFSLAAPAPAYRVLVNVADTLSWETQTVDSLVSREAPAGSYL